MRDAVLNSLATRSEYMQLVGYLFTKFALENEVKNINVSKKKPLWLSYFKIILA